MPRCAPIKLDLDLARPQAKVNRRYTLWFKLRLTNISCYKLGLLDATPFMNWLDGYSHDPVTWRVVGPDGGVLPILGQPSSTDIYTDELKKLPAHRNSALPKMPASFSEYGGILPYEDEPNSFARFKANPALTIDENGFVELLPGRSMETLGSVLSPHTKRLEDVRTPNGGLGTAEIHVPATLKDAESAIPGFRVMNEYVFTKPGKYTIQASFDDSFIRAEPLYPYADRVPGIVKYLLYSVGLIDGLDADPVFRDKGEYHNVRAESSVISFEVTP